MAAKEIWNEKPVETDAGIVTKRIRTFGMDAEADLADLPEDCLVGSGAYLFDMTAMWTWNGEEWIKAGGESDA